MPSLRELKERRAGLWETMQDLAGAADERSWSNAEQRAFDRADAELRKIDEELAARGESLATPRTSIVENGAQRKFSGTRLADRRILGREERVADWVRARGLVEDDAAELSFAKTIRGIATGTWHEAEAEQRAFAEGVLASGGYVVPVTTTSKIIDVARNAAKVMSLGASTVLLDENIVKIPRQLNDPALTWHAENQLISESSINFDVVTFTVQTLPCLVKFSWELLQDATNLEPFVIGAIGKAMAVEIDRAALRGSGTAPEPKGIRFQTGVNIQTFGGANGGTPVDYSWIVTAMQTLRSANFEPGGVLYSPRTAATLANLQDTLHQPLRQPDDVAALTKAVTNQIGNAYTVGTSTDTSEAYLGDWAQVMIGWRTQLQVQPLRERYADLGQIGVVAYMRCDIQVAHPAAFVVVTGLRP